MDWHQVAAAKNLVKDLDEIPSNKCCLDFLKEK
jgi:hypothetical protein